MRKRHYALVILWFLPALVAPAGAQRTGGEIAAVMQRLTPAQKAAQLIMPWVSGNYSAFDDPVFERILVLVDSLQIGGVVISIGPPTEIAARLNHLQRKARIPLLVASDFEGGTAFRVIGGTPFPTNMGVGAGGREADAYQMGRIMAEEARALGVHLTFSPVADVNNNPANPIINTRSFGSDPRQVARLVEAQIRGSQDHGLLATAKHFPGHGDTQTDSHLALPVIEADWRRLDTLELVPFRAAIRAGVAAVMSAHVTLPGLDSGRSRPATMVPGILTGILRDSLGFQGLIITDALDMGGVVRSYDAGEAAVSALLAGSDILLMPTDPVAAVEAVVAAVEGGRIPPARLDSSVRKVLALKARLGLFRRRTVNLDSVGSIVGRRASLEAASASARRSLVLLRDQIGFFDSVSTGERSIALVSYTDAGSGPGAVLASELRARGHRVTLNRLTPQSGPASYDSARAAVDTTDLALYAVAVRPREGAGRIDLPAPLADLITGTNAGTMLVSFGSPYIIAQVPQVAGYLVAWANAPISERAVVNALHGAPVTGTLPVGLPPLFRIHDGLTRTGGQAGRRTALPTARPPLPPSTLNWLPLARLVDSAVEAGAAPGAVVAISIGGVQYIHGTGRLGIGDTARPDPSTIYDLASLTKVIGLTTGLMLAVSEGRIDLDSPVQRYVARFSGPLKERVTIRHLLTHSSGLRDGRRLWLETPDAATALALVDTTLLDTVPGARTVYSDLGAMVLTQALEEAYQTRIDTLLANRVFGPLGMQSTRFLPPASWQSRIAPTEDDPWRGRVLRGEVHDENAAWLGGVSGHAGLFSSGEDLLRFGEWLLRLTNRQTDRPTDGHGSSDGLAIRPSPIPIGLSVAREFLRRQELVPGSSRALGWDTPSPNSSAGSRLSPRSFGHTGFTGTSIWTDPDRKLVIVLLTNRVHPTRENSRHIALRRAVADLAADIADASNLVDM